ncbi:metallo-beta-lactamase superfamily protein [Lysobacter antibioticus]|uniref:Metallo-beta-lactamase superfamily protein n=1 Tax=Lysobacter antibioticus TaxID=84531 RepID=A0A0S2F965_LYSAN|nr:MBL fold metallo-hydrolase [Lysobacter antibioticus]ALN80089.1 metallo-beta-lactamase superfamily protein [Lysobacter antibioticus]
MSKRPVYNHRLFLAISAACLSLALAACGRHESAPAESSSAPTAAVPPTPAEAAAAPLKTEVYNPGKQGIFEVSSVLVSGARDAVLIDAQFAAADARKLVDLVKASGKRLTTIYISHGDPDFYFGLDTLQDAFPEAKIVATPQTVEHIRSTQEGKFAYWGPKLGANAPKRIVVPQALAGDRIDLEGRSLQIVGLDGATPDRSYVWIPSIRTVAGGVPVVAGEHLFMADTQTPQSHQAWLDTLKRIEELKPDVVIPGHFAEGAAQNVEAVRFSAGYIRAFDEEAAKAADSKALIAAMKKRYPDLGGDLSLEISAKVAKGEMPWH